MSEQKTIYCGSGKKGNDKWRKVSICLSTLPKEHMFEYNGKTYIKLNINDKDEPDQYEKDVSVSVDTWKPEAQDNTVHVKPITTQPVTPAMTTPSVTQEDGLPF